MKENADSEKHLTFSQMMRAHESTPEKTLIRMLVMEIWLPRWCSSLKKKKIHLPMQEM